MAHTYTNILTHVIFSTKDRIPNIDAELKPQLYAYINGIARELKTELLAINGAADHLHLLIMLPAQLALADALRVLKTNSSRWVHEKWVSRQDFGWQTGYGAFSVSQSKVSNVLSYIANQEQHHQKRSFQKEFIEYLNKNGIEYDERYIWH